MIDQVLSNGLLTLSDVVIAVPQDSLQKTIKSLFDEKKLNENIDITINESEDKSLKASFGPPEINFRFDAQIGSVARLKFPVINGAYYGGDKVVKTKTPTGAVKKEIISYVVEWKAGMFLEYDVKLDNKVQVFHDADLTVEAIYLELTQISKINLEALGLAPDDAPDIKNACVSLAYVFKDAYKGITSLEKDNQLPRLFIGSVNIPKVPDTEGIFAPKASRQTVTRGESTDETSELDFLLYINAEDPRLKNTSISTFNRPWAGHRKELVSDVVLVLSQSLILENLIKPAFEKSINTGGNLVTKKTTVDHAERIVLELVEAPEPDTKEVRITFFECYISGFESGKLFLNVVIEARKMESILIETVSLFPINVLTGRKQSFTYVLNVENNTVTSDQKNFSEEVYPPQPIFDPSVHSPEDIVKWGVVPIAVVISPILVPVAAAITAAIILVIKDSLSAGNFYDISYGLFKQVRILTEQIELPGSPVFKYDNLSFFEGNLLFDGKRIDIPEVRTTDNKPYDIPSPPKIQILDEELGSRETERVLIGETLVHHKYVNDPTFKGVKAEQSPYYILSREQFWYRQDYKTSAGLGQQTLSLDVKFGVTKQTQEKLTQTLNAEISSNGSFSFKGISVGLKDTISRELKQETTSTETMATEYTESRQYISPNTQGRAFTIAIWVLADEYILKRMDGFTVDCYRIDDKSHVVEKGFPEFGWTLVPNTMVQS